MHLKSCCMLFLLALVACQAAPSTSKNIVKKSISEKTSKIEKDDMKMEDPGMDKDRTKKSATTFCVEVRDGTEQQVPCAETKRPLVLVQPEPAKQMPVQTVQPHLQSLPQPAPQPATQPVIFLQPPAQYSLPAVQTPPPQQAPIVNILTPPAAPCNVLPTPTVIRQESKYEPAKEVEHLKPLPKLEPEPELRPKPIAMPQTVEFLSVVEPVSCKKELVVLPSKPIMEYPEKQLTLQVTELEHQPHVLSDTQCICAHKGQQNPSWPRHHHKVHEHHVMVHPTANIAPATPLIVQPSCPLSYLSSNHPTVLGYPGTAYGDTIISVHQENAHPYYPDVSPSLYPVTSHEYISYPVKTYESRPYTAPSVTVNAFTDPTRDFRQAQSSHSQKLKENNKSERGYPVTRAIANVPTGTSKREADSIQQLEQQNQQTNVVQERVAESGKTPVEMKFGGQESTTM
ncbi:proline-rich extensin-like protein EPR1 isoform X3 [Harpegnathos saltator]|uniref:proline-rich extensin-like protein EPR1 isoform X3 n=1 Tax=Harpegnathos saltator TaxID=610380 RepID=UPI00058E80DC|nr:proline-rich extensin-like protein EPR1 isoform X3 [Harpegnathos saltator]